MKLIQDKHKKKSGRPSKLTDKVVKDAEKVWALDGSNRDVAGFVGVNVTTVDNWLRKGEAAHHGIHRDFYLAQLRGYASNRMDALTAIHKKIVDGDAHLALRKLQIRDPARWREAPHRQELTGRDGSPLPVADPSTVRFVIENHDGKEIMARDAVTDALHTNGDTP